jgi:Zn-dependent peptidase ImmA (M78 family)
VKYLSRAVLENPYAYLDSEGGYDAFANRRARTIALIDKDHLLGGRMRGRAFPRHEIEEIARNLHIEMWRRRVAIFRTPEDVGPMQILDPVLALESLGYEVVVHESLGQYWAGRASFEVAGVVDNSKEKVELSRHFDPEIRNFTAAHELGHAILHRGSGLHRDRALAAGITGPRDRQEMEADAFASFFLLPEKQVRLAFEAKFLTQKFGLTEASAFALAVGSLADLRRRCRSEYDLARTLAIAKQYNGVHFRCLAEQFGVSTQAMTIRLEELHLVSLE